jgi:hypothetical protein
VSADDSGDLIEYLIDEFLFAEVCGRHDKSDLMKLASDFLEVRHHAPSTVASACSAFLAASQSASAFSVMRGQPSTASSMAGALPALFSA